MCCGDQPAGPPVAIDNPNTLGWSGDGSGDGGQYYYDLGLDVSPTDPDRMFSAGISVWRSENGGADWEINAHWVTWATELTPDRYTHADVHDVKFFETESGVDMWVASDGGLFYSSDQGDNMEPRMYGIHGTDFWGWQAGAKHGDVQVGGTYHNGTLIRNGDIYPWGLDDEDSGGWLAELAGDNFRGFVNPGDATVGYHDGGAFKYSPDRWTRITGLSFDNSKLPNTSYFWGEYGNMEFDPACYNHIYSPVGSELWKSENGGSSFELLHDFGGDKAICVKVAPRDRDRIYVTHRISGTWRISRSDDGGATWTEITPASGTVGGNNGNAKYIDVDGMDPDKLWVVILGWQGGNKIFQSNDAGENWTDLTGDAIDDQYVTQLAHQRGTSDGIYVGTQQAVYYKNASMSDWEMYNLDLPASTAAVFMQNNYCDEKVRIAGSRGVHQADFYEESDVIAGLTASKLKINLGVQCEADTIRFTDNSVVACEGASFIWNFEGGTASSLTDETVYVVYDETGTFNVTLTVIGANGGTDTVMWEDLIEVVDEPVGMPLTEDFNDEWPPLHWKLENPEGGGMWEHGTVLDDETNRVAQFPNYWVDTNGQTDLLVMPAQDFTDIENPLLHFDVSYQLYADYIDGLAVLYKTDPADDWGVLYEKLGADLAVEDNYVWFWYDLGGQLIWRTDSVDLSPLAGESCVTLAFSNIGGYGNHIWIDNVNLTADGLVNVPNENLDRYLNVFPNPATDQLNFKFPEALGSGIARLYDAHGRLVAETRSNGYSTLEISNLAKGMYTLVLTFGDGMASKKVIMD
jgi:PKD repeat protein